MAQHGRKLFTGRIAALTRSKSVRRVAASVTVLSLLAVPPLVAYVSTTEPIVLSSSTQGNLYLAANELSLTAGKAATATIRIEPGTPIDTVTATLRFDQAKLAYSSVAYTDSPFTTQVPATSTDSSVTVQAAKFGGPTVSSDAVIATVTFMAKQSGVTTLGLSGNAARAGVATNPLVNGARAGGQQAGTPALAVSQAPVSESNNPGSSSQAPDTSLPGAAPVRELLKSLGMTSAKARAVAPVLTLSLTLVGLGSIGYLVYSRVIQPHRKRISSQETEGHHEN